jgi:hypothetical protein
MRPVVEKATKAAAFVSAVETMGADVVLAFPGGRGTADCVRRAKAAGIYVRHVPAGFPREREA